MERLFDVNLVGRNGEFAQDTDRSVECFVLLSHPLSAVPLLVVGSDVGHFQL